MQKDTCCSWDVWSHVVLRAFVLTYAIHFWVYLSQSEVERTDLASPNHNFVQFAKSTWFGIQSTRTNQRLKIADLQLISVSRVPICKQTNRAGFKTWPSAFGLGRVKTNRLKFKTRLSNKREINPNLACQVYPAYFISEAENRTTSDQSVISKMEPLHLVFVEYFVSDTISMSKFTEIFRPLSCSNHLASLKMKITRNFSMKVTAVDVDVKSLLIMRTLC